MSFPAQTQKNNNPKSLFLFRGYANSSDNYLQSQIIGLYLIMYLPSRRTKFWLIHDRLRIFAPRPLGTYPQEQFRIFHHYTPALFHVNPYSNYTRQRAAELIAQIIRIKKQRLEERATLRRIIRHGGEQISHRNLT